MSHQSHLQPLSRRLSPAEATKRSVRMSNRQNQRVSVAQAIGETRAIAVAAYSVLRRGFFGRLKWLLFGK